MMRVFIFSFIILASLFSIAGQNNACGFIYPTGESARMALNDEDTYSYLLVDCRAKRQSSQELSDKFLGYNNLNTAQNSKKLILGVKSLLPQQKAWITRARADLVKRNSTSKQSSSAIRASAPYVCLSGINLKQDPCIDTKTYFESRVEKISHIHVSLNEVRKFIKKTNDL